MARLRPDLDIILDMLNTLQEALPGSAFIRSLHRQYLERGGLSKKQLQGLLGIAQRSGKIPSARLATLEAIILKRHVKEKSPLPPNLPLYQKDPGDGEMIRAILSKFPAHKRVLFLRGKYENNEPLSATEKDELRKFAKLL